MGWLITVVFPFRGSDCKFSHLLNSWVWKSLWIMLTLISQSSPAEIRSSRSALATHPQNLAFWESLSNLWCRWLLQISFFSYMITFSTMLPMGCAFDRSVRSVALTTPWLQLRRHQLKNAFSEWEKQKRTCPSEVQNDLKGIGFIQESFEKAQLIWFGDKLANVGSKKKKQNRGYCRAKPKTCWARLQMLPHAQHDGGVGMFLKQSASTESSQ